MTRNHKARIDYIMQANAWSIDRTAVELNCTTPDLRWLMAGHPAESWRQQVRLDNIVKALDAREILATVQDATHPRLMRRTPQNAKNRTDMCRNGHLYERGTYHTSSNGRRICHHCMEERNRQRHSYLAAARSALGTLSGRGLRDVEIAVITGISNASISGWRCGGTGISIDRVNELNILVAVTNDLTGKERGKAKMYTPHPMLDEITTRYLGQLMKVAA